MRAEVHLHTERQFGLVLAQRRTTSTAAVSTSGARARRSEAKMSELIPSMDMSFLLLILLRVIGLIPLRVIGALRVRPRVWPRRVAGVDPLEPPLKFTRRGSRV